MLCNAQSLAGKNQLALYLTSTSALKVTASLTESVSKHEGEGETQADKLKFIMASTSSLGHIQVNKDMYTQVKV